MPPKTKVDYTVLVIDRFTLEDAEVRDKLTQILTQKMFVNPNKFVMSLILLNTEKTQNNRLYPHVTTLVSDPENFDVKYLKEAEGFDSGGAANWMQALLLAAEMLRNSPKSYDVVGKRILMITDFKHLVKVETQICDVAETLRSSDVYLSIIGPPVDVRGPIIFPKSYCEDLCIDSNIKDVRVLDGLRKAKEILETVDGFITNIQVGTELYLYHQCYFPKQNSKEMLTLGNHEIQVVTKGCTDDAPTISFEGESKKRAWTDWKYVKASNIEDDVSFQDVQKGLNIHGHFIPMTDELKRSFKGDASKIFSIIGFTDRKNVPELFMFDKTSYVLPSDTPTEATVFTALVRTMIEGGLYAIALRNYRVNLAPKLYVLIPQVEPECLTIVQIPFKYDFARKKFNYFEDPDEIREELAGGNESPDNNEDLTQRVGDYLTTLSHANDNGLDFSMKLQPDRVMAYLRMKNRYEDVDLEEQLPSIQELLCSRDVSQDANLLQLKALWNNDG